MHQSGVLANFRKTAPPPVSASGLMPTKGPRCPISIIIESGPLSTVPTLNMGSTAVTRSRTSPHCFAAVSRSKRRLRSCGLLQPLTARIRVQARRYTQDPREHPDCKARQRPPAFGAALLNATGSPAHLEALRSFAQIEGLLLGCAWPLEGAEVGRRCQRRGYLRPTRPTVHSSGAARRRRWRWHRRSLELGCMLSINSDARSIDEIDLTHWGVERIRRAAQAFRPLGSVAKRLPRSRVG